MTCIVAIKEGNGSGAIIYMGADSAGVDGNLSMQIRKDEKICHVGPFMFGFTTSFRMGQLLAHAFECPERPVDVSIEKFMCTTFVDAVRKCLKDGGYARKDNEVESAGTFLVAYEGRLFYVYDDYQVGETDAPYAAVGCGADIAMGSLNTTNRAPNFFPAENRLTMALEAAAEFSAGVRAPFVFYKQKYEMKEQQCN